jgi:purine nucleoside phosphorylase
MFRKLAAAIVAASLIAGPALAQGTTQSTTIVPVTKSAPAVKADAKVQKSELIVTKTKKHVAMHRHTRKHFAHVRHVKHVKFVKHVKHLKQVKNPAKGKIAG